MVHKVTFFAQATGANGQPIHDVWGVQVTLRNLNAPGFGATFLEDTVLGARLIDSQGRSYGWPASNALDQYRILQLAPGATRQTWLFFRLPEGARPLRFVYTEHEQQAKPRGSTAEWSVGN